MDMSGAGRRQPRRAQQPQQPPPPQPASNPYENSFAANPGYYNPNAFYDGGGHQPVPMFDEPSNAGSYSGNDIYYGQQQPVGPYGAGQPVAPGPVGFGFPPGPGGQDPTAVFNNQFLMQAGSQMLQNQAMGMANQYVNNFTEKGRSWIGSNLKYYFAVDTAYVLKKLLLIFFPFTQKDWTVRFTPNEPIAPRDDLNAPDLYIPSMAILTYLLVVGYLLGIGNTFSPEKLGLHASTTLAWLIAEVCLIMFALYISSISCCLGFFHVLAFSSYKFVCMIGALLAGMIINTTAYYAFLGYSIFSLCFFLMRSLHVAIQTTSTSHGSPRNGLPVVLAVCGFQAVLMYWSTKNYVGITVV